MKNFFTLITLILIPFILLAQQSLIYNDDGAIRKVDIDGSNYGTIIEAPSITNDLYDVEVDTFIDQVFWSDEGMKEITKSNLDGSNATVIYSNTNSLTKIRGIALDESTQKIYWVENKKILSADYDGSNVTVVIDENSIPNTSPFTHLEIDYANNKFYWIQDYYIYDPISNTGSRDMQVKSANLDGTGITSLSTSSSNYELILDLDLDLKNGKIYFIEYNRSVSSGIFGTTTYYYIYVKSMELDGTNKATFKTFNDYINTKVDIDESKDEVILIRSGDIIRYLPDATEISTTTNPNLLSGGNFFYSSKDDNIFIIDNDNLEKISEDGLTWDIIKFSNNISARFVEYDELNNWVYWYDSYGYIAKIRPDGTEFTILYDIELQASGVSDFKIDNINNKIYWTNINELNSINLDGTGKQTLATLATNEYVRDIKLDISNSKVYFRGRISTSPFTSRILSVKFDGTSLTQIIADLGTTANEGFTVHLPTGKFYWTDTVNDIIKQSDSDGNNITNIYTVAQSNVNEMTTSNNKLHWYVAGGIYYSDLDGTNVMAVPGITAVNLRSIAISQTTVLPVELGYFKGVQVEDTNHLKWNTLSEINNEGFEIERSSDGITWDYIGYKEGRGYSSEEINYTFIDERPLFGDNYYRLRQVDYDGAFEYSDVIIISFETRIKIALSPVPTKDILTITFPDLDDNVNATLRIVDVLGRIISEKELQVGKDATQYTMDVSNLAPGTYYTVAMIGKSKYKNVSLFIIAKD